MPQRQRLILHIGQHKTGTTYLQRRFVDDRERLKQASILYPEEFIEIFGHHQVASIFRWSVNSDEAKRLSDILARHGRSWTTVVLSTENLCFLSRDSVAVLARALVGWDVEIVYYLRRLSGFWPSHWQELIKHGSDITFDRYLLENLKQERDENNFPDQGRQLRRFTEQFGAENVWIFAYDNILTRNVDIYDSFLRYLLQVPASGSGGRTSMNASFPPQRIELLRSLHMIQSQRTGNKTDIRLRQAYMRAHKKIEASDDFALFADAFHDWCMTYRLEATDEVIRAREAALLTDFGPQIVNKASADSIFLPTNPVDVRYAPRDWVYAAGQLNYVRSLLDQITQTMLQ